MRHSQDWRVLLQAPCFLKALSLLGSGWIHNNPIRCGVQRSCSSGNLGSSGKAPLISFDHFRGMDFNMLYIYILYLEAVSALKLIACSDCRIMNDLCCGHAWTNGVTDCCFKLPFVVPPTRRMCPTSTWSPPSSPCSWTEQAAMLVFWRKNPFTASSIWRCGTSLLCQVLPARRAAAQLCQHYGVSILVVKLWPVGANFRVRLSCGDSTSRSRT